VKVFMHGIKARIVFIKRRKEVLGDYNNYNSGGDFVGAGEGRAGGIECYR
jgi:hypothetical protein